MRNSMSRPPGPRVGSLKTKEIGSAKVPTSFFQAIITSPINDSRSSAPSRSSLTVARCGPDSLASALLPYCRVMC